MQQGSIIHFPRVGLNEILKFGCNGDTGYLCDRAATSALSRHRPGDRCFAASESFQFFALISSFSGCASNPEFEKLLQNIRGGLDRGG